MPEPLQAPTPQRARRSRMSLQRRLVVYLSICAPLVWALALGVSISRARHEINELYDTELIRIARQIQATLPEQPGALGNRLRPAPKLGSSESGEGDIRDLAVAVWDAQGRMTVADREGADLPYKPQAAGFFDEQIGSRRWRVYYLQSFSGEVVVAAGQNLHERDEIVYALTVTQVVPWLLVLPVLLLVMALAVRRALLPVRQLADGLHARGPNDLMPVPQDDAPTELRPLLGAMNSLFARISEMLVRERRFTADAAHELRTPLSVLRAQWDVVRRSGSDAERAQAEAKLDLGFARMERLVTQMLALSRVEASNAARADVEVDWAGVVEDVISDCLPMAARRGVELGCEWPAAGRHPMPLFGDPHLLGVLLRNLVDNAVRYAPAPSTVTLRLLEDRIEVDNDGAPLAPGQVARLGERFYRPAGQQESGSGLGVSIVQRIAALHGLAVVFGTQPGPRGVRVTVRFAPVRAPPVAPTSS